MQREGKSQVVICSKEQIFPERTATLLVLLEEEDLWESILGTPFPPSFARMSGSFDPKQPATMETASSRC